jgi:hypothetical protein
MTTRKPKSTPASDDGTSRTRGSDRARVDNDRVRDRLKALGAAHADVAEGQSRIFKLLLGLEPPADAHQIPVASRKSSGGDAFQLPTLAGFLDSKLAESLKRLGVPEAAELEERINRIEERLSVLEQAASEARPSSRARKR